MAFHAQQAIEKSLKAILEEKSGHVRKIHNLEKLFRDVSEYIKFENNLDLIMELDKLYIDARYPGDLGLLPNGKPTLNDAKNYFEFANTIYNHIDIFLQD